MLGWLRRLGQHTTTAAAEFSAFANDDDDDDDDLSGSGTSDNGSDQKSDLNEDVNVELQQGGDHLNRILLAMI